MLLLNHCGGLTCHLQVAPGTNIKKTTRFTTCTQMALNELICFLLSPLEAAQIGGWVLLRKPNIRQYKHEDYNRECRICIADDSASQCSAPFGLRTLLV